MIIVCRKKMFANFFLREVMQVLANGSEYELA